MISHSINADQVKELELHVILLREGEWPVTSVARFTTGKGPIDFVCPVKYVSYIQAMYADVRVPVLSLSFLYF
jgi:hypothetical protein